MGGVKETPIARRLVRMVSLCVFAGIVVVACASEPPRPVDASVLLPLPPGYSVVDQSPDGDTTRFCNHISCGRWWDVRPEDESREPDLHAGVIAAHVGELTGVVLEPDSSPSETLRYSYESDDLRIRIRVRDSGDITVQVSNQ